MKLIVLMSTYNGERYLREQLNSLVTQKLKPFQILIRDDGSSDATKDITDKIEWYSNNCSECHPLKISSTEGLTNDYVTGIITQLKNISEIKKRNFNIVVDIMHGSSAEAFKKLAEELNISYKLLNEKPLGFCDYEPRPCKENNKELIGED